MTATRILSLANSKQEVIPTYSITIEFSESSSGLMVYFEESFGDGKTLHLISQALVIDSTLSNSE